jgi:hypothetical protein
MNRKIQTHANFNADDYAYLAAKGWTDAEILKRWNEERAAGKSACTWNTFGARSKLASTLRTK